MLLSNNTINQGKVKFKGQKCYYCLYKYKWARAQIDLNHQQQVRRPTTI